jgi:hypothetical protein
MHRPRTSLKAVEQSEGSRTAIIKNTEGDLPFPWSEKDPYALPVSIDRVQRMLLGLGGWLLAEQEERVDGLACSLALYDMVRPCSHVEGLTFVT